MLLNDEETRKDKSLILNDIKSNKQTYYFVLIILGLLNNLGYVLVNSSAQQLGRQFHQEKLMSLFTFCLTFLGVVTSLANSKYLLKIRHYTKIKITVLSFCAAYVFVGVSNTIPNIFGFFLCLVGSIIMGISTTLGSQTILGFLKGFDPDLLSGWGCGTGFAGVFGAGINFLLRFIDIPGYLIFLGMLPTNLVYLLCFKWLKDQKVSQIDRNEQEFNRPLRNLGKGADSYDRGSAANEDKDQQEADINQALTIENLKRVWPKTWTYTLNQSSVYFLEYTIITVFADKATNQYKNSSVSFEVYAFIFLNFCYQVGVVISRSSLACFKIRRVGVISILQLINFGVWAWIAYEKQLSLGLILVLMIYVGLMGGASYINTLYLAMETEDLKKKDKEIAVNILNMFDNIGIILATLLSLLLANTVYADK